MMRGIKPGVNVYGVRPEMTLVDNIVASVYAAYGFNCYQTSIVGKSHSKYSLHPVGFAIDYRTKHIRGEGRKVMLEALVISLKQALPQCDIVLEYLGEDEEHIHVEFDPKDDPAFQDDKATYRETGKWPS